MVITNDSNSLIMIDRGFWLSLHFFFPNQIISNQSSSFSEILSSFSFPGMPDHLRHARHSWRDLSSLFRLRLSTSTPDPHYGPNLHNPTHPGFSCLNAPSTFLPPLMCSYFSHSWKGFSGNFSSSCSIKILFIL